MAEQSKVVQSGQRGPDKADRFWWLWLVLAVILSFFAGGRWVIPVTAWFAPLFLLHIVRSRRPLAGYLLATLIRALAAVVVLQGIIPLQGIAYYLLVIFLSSVDLPALPG